MKKFILIVVVVVLILGSTIGAFCFLGKDDAGGKGPIGGSGDFWVYKGPIEESEGFFSGFPTIGSFNTAGMAQSSIAMDSANIGFSVGGAKDINNFRENIKNGYFPISTDITYNGLFYDYAFDTGIAAKSDELFSPAYSVAVSKDPVSGKLEYYMTVGLNSNIKESDFARKKLNLVVVLDISGSMSSSFNSYYYDDPFALKGENKDKMTVALESINVLLDQLNAEDRFGMILFDDGAYVGQEISLVGDTDIVKLKEHILEVQANGGTNFEAGYKEGTKLFSEYKNIDTNEYENRIIFLTDAMPNVGNTSKDSLLDMVKENAEDGIYTTFIGIGVDFNTKLIEAITDNKGANYYAVHSAEEFETRMGEEFEFMVTPLVFDLELNVDSKDFEIAKIYGSDSANEETGNIMKVNTLFPSKSNEDGEVKGGVILLKLNKISDEEVGKIAVTVSYKDRTGKAFSNNQIVNFENTTEERYDNTGIRKAITLTRYANVMKNWILYERAEEERFLIVSLSGICDCDYTPEEIRIMLGEHERMSVDLTVSEEYKEIFKGIKTYINEQNKVLEDKTFEKEIEILDQLIETK